MTDITPIGRIANVILGVTDLARSVGFYRDKLGLRLVQETPGWAFFDGGGVTLCLSQAHARLNEKIAGATEVVLAVNDIDAGHSLLSERGVEFMNAPRQVTGSQWAANFRDPDGHLLSIFGAKKGGDES